MDVSWLLLGGLGALGMVRQAKTARQNILESPVRARIVEIVRSRPGLLLSDLRRRLGCSAGTIQHHLRLLEETGVLASHVSSQRRHLFPADVDAGTRASLSVLARRSRAIDFLRLVLRNPGIQQPKVTDGLAISRKALRNYVAEMTKCGLVDTRMAGGRRAYHPTAALDDFLRAVDGVPPSREPNALAPERDGRPELPGPGLPGPHQ